MTFQTYNLSIPNPPNRPSADVPLMQTNTNSISNLILQDHFGFNDNAGGNHKQVHLKNTAAPGGIGANADAVFYANTSSGQSFPFWQNALGSTQLFGPITIAASGSVTVAGGIVIKWGSVTNPGGSGPVSFAGGNFTNVWSVQLTPRNDGSHSAFTYYLDGAPTVSGFSYRASISSGPQTLFYIAIGN